MSLILNIDTAFNSASVCLYETGDVIQLSFSENQKDHASWLHTEIAGLLQKSGKRMKDLDAVAVAIGPGSFTGLRIGLAAAKGFCYSLQIPLITVSSLKLIAFAVKDEAHNLICPLIDARRMEVFTAVYDKMLQEKVSPHALVIDEQSFASLLSSGKILFCGNAVKKLQALISNSNAFYSKTIADASHLAQLSFDCFNKKEFAGLVDAEPMYIKEFYSGRTGI
jgi:tRNA threonylcarbamoyladenosine biosynthesis protein TsaB